MKPNKQRQKRIEEAQAGEYVACDFYNTEENENSVYNHDNKCRICLDPAKRPIFGDETSLDLSTDIKIFGDIEINADDSLPKCICDSCLKLLEAALLFRRTAKQSDEYLRSNQEKSIADLIDIIGCPEFQFKTDPDISIEPSIAENVTKIKDEFIEEPIFTNDSDAYLEDTAVNNLMSITIGNVNSELQIDENTSAAELLTSNNYKCKTCGLHFQSLKEYSRHKKSLKHKQARQCNKIECQICSKQISRAYFNRHVNMHSDDSKEDKLQCPFCSKSYKKTYFNYHITHAHNKDHKKEEPERIQCPICNKSYEKQYYKFHLAIHEDGSSKYVCDTCGKSFIQQSAFKRHRLIHGTELAYKCTLCPYRGRHPGLVKTHMQTHTRDYQHRCMECPARFLTKSNLNKHLRRHKGPVDFKCETCKRGFYSKLELDRHFAADHLGVKNHVCNVCGKAFGYRNAMMSHQLKVHKREKLTNGKGRLPLYLEAERKNDS